MSNWKEFQEWCDNQLKDYEILEIPINSYRIGLIHKCRIKRYKHFKNE